MDKFENKYKETMENIEITPEMRARILKNVEDKVDDSTYIVKDRSVITPLKKANVVRIVSAISGAAVVLIIAGIILTNSVRYSKNYDTVNLAPEMNSADVEEELAFGGANKEDEEFDGITAAATEAYDPSLDKNGLEAEEVVQEVEDAQSGVQNFSSSRSYFNKEDTERVYCVIGDSKYIMCMPDKFADIFSIMNGEGVALIGEVENPCEYIALVFEFSSEGRVTYYVCGDTICKNQSYYLIKNNSVDTIQQQLIDYFETNYDMVE